MAVTAIRFEPYNEEDIEQYFERVEMFLMANAVEEGKKVGHVLSVIGATAYSCYETCWHLQTRKIVIWQP